MEPVFIMLEGGEGSGKSTLASNLEKALLCAGHDIVRTREPGGTPWGEKVRKLIIEHDESIDHRMAPVTQLMGMYMARFEHLERVIIPALVEGKVVISDRFELSSYAYQVHAQGDEALKRIFIDLHAHVLERLRPFTCVYLYCDIHPEVGLARVDARGDQKTVFDMETLDFHHRVREGMVHAQTCIDPHFQCVTIDAHQTPEKMLRDAIQALHQS